MRWEALFADMEAQVDAARILDWEAEVAERARAEAASVTLLDRLRGAVGDRLELRFGGAAGASSAGSAALAGVLHLVGDDWLMLRVDQRSAVVPLNAVLSVEGLGRTAIRPSGAIRRSLASILRLLARDRSVVTFQLGGSVPERFTAVIDGVGSDHCDVAVLRDGELRREGHIVTRRTVPFSGIQTLLSPPREA
ncbi:hypothetical protein [Psychromicrobium xiongbiense]|uniref:hypothetical protein n=1 Tax=Psychromicrobium xiongbiense TaxID=3051184 RepID=UPI002557A3BE|nr:hypothetical protein [Psychromicrobium sp. YIM S02556]